MEINAKRINELAKETGFIRDNLEKMARLLQMLDVLFASPWKDKLVLKGGTISFTLDCLAFPSTSIWIIAVPAKKKP